MALLFMDGFDKYGQIANNSGSGQSSPAVNTLLTSGQGITVNPGVWTATTQGGSGLISIVAGLSSTGFALQLAGSSAGSSAIVKKTLSASYARLIGGVRVNVGSLLGTGGMEFVDGATNQCSWEINPTTGTISVCTGAMGGTVIGTSVTAMTANSTHYIEWDITFAASGAFQIWIDGVSVLSGTGATKVSANSSANGVWLALFTSSSQNTQYDDLYVFDTSGAQNNAVLNTNPRIETQFPVSDSQTQFTNGASIIGHDYFVSTGGTNAPGANTVFVEKFTPSVNMTINSVSCLPRATSAGANFRSVVYADSGGPSGAPLGTGTQVTGTTTGTVLTSTLAVSVNLTGGTAYWIGFITDTSVVLQEVDATTTGFQAANTYASGPPTTPAVTSGHPTWMLWGNCTGATVNWASVNLNPPVSDSSYAFSSAVNQEDLQNFPALSVNPSNIYAVQVTVFGKKTDAGARTVSLDMKSGVADGNGNNSGFTPPTTYGYLSSIFELDPNTSAAWTYTALNAATTGYKVVS